MAAVRLAITLNSQSEWLKIFDPHGWTVFVATDDPPDPDSQLRLDLDVRGWKVTLRGVAVSTRDNPTGVLVALSSTEREKINFLNGYVRGGIINHREKRRLPIKLPVTYGAIEGPAQTTTRDISEEGLFLFTDKPLPETSQIHMLVNAPGRDQPLSLMGKVSHTILPHDDEPPGMGVVFVLDDATRADLTATLDRLEQALVANELPASLID